MTNKKTVEEQNFLRMFENFFGGEICRKKFNCVEKVLRGDRNVDD